MSNVPFAPTPSPTTAHLRLNTFSLGVYQNLSELIRTYQNQSDTFRLVLINSDKFRYPLTNIPIVPYHLLPPPQRTFAPASAYSPHQFSTPTCHRSAPPPQLQRTFPSIIPPTPLTAVQLQPQTHARVASRLGTFVLFSTEGSERVSHTIKSLLPYSPSVCTEVSGESLESFSRKSREFSEKVYRVFSESL